MAKLIFLHVTSIDINVIFHTQTFAISCSAELLQHRHYVLFLSAEQNGRYNLQGDHIPDSTNSLPFPEASDACYLVTMAISEWRLRSH